MESIGTRLIDQIKRLNELEVQRLEIQLAKFNKEINECYESKINLIEENIDNQIKYYGKNISSYTKEKNSILNRYKEEFQKNYDKRKEQFFNIIVEIQEMQANQKIALTNFKKIAEDKENFMQNFKKLEALVNKYAGYNEIILECEAKLNDCILATKKDFEQITKYRNPSIAVIEKGNFITNIINKILNKFSGKSKFEKEVINKMEKELLEVEKNNILNLEIIDKQTINLVAKIEELREIMNSEFKFAVE